MTRHPFPRLSALLGVAGLAYDLARDAWQSRGGGARLARAIVAQVSAERDDALREASALSVRVGMLSEDGETLVRERDAALHLLVPVQEAARHYMASMSDVNAGSALMGAAVATIAGELLAAPPMPACHHCGATASDAVVLLAARLTRGAWECEDAETCAGRQRRAAE